MVTTYLVIGLVGVVTLVVCASARPPRDGARPHPAVRPRRVVAPPVRTGPVARIGTAAGAAARRTSLPAVYEPGDWSGCPDPARRPRPGAGGLAA